jgi:hypothetical protein
MSCPPTLAPLSPGAYLKARRCAAGLSVADVAARFSTATRWKEHDRVFWLELIEADVQPASAFTLDALRGLFPFDPDVLARLDAIALGALPAEDAPQLCRICACSELDPCWHADGEPCSWAEPDLCSACRHPAPAAPVASAAA